MIRYLVGADGTAARRRCPRWLALAAGLRLLTGCALPAEPGLQVASAAPSHGAPETAQPRITDSALIAADGAALPLRKWLPRSGVKAVILALHGFNDYSNAFAMPASLWAERGIARKATYYYGARRRRDLCFEKELRALEESLLSFSYVPALSEPAESDGWEGETGLITDVMKRHETGLSKPRLYCFQPQQQPSLLCHSLKEHPGFQG